MADNTSNVKPSTAEPSNEPSTAEPSNEPSTAEPSNAEPSNVELSDAYKKAIEDSKKLLAKPSNDNLLQLYALFKHGNGEDISKAIVPGMFDLKGKAKKAAWQKVVDEGITPEVAQERYVALVKELKDDLGYDKNKEPEAVNA